MAEIITKKQKLLNELEEFTLEKLKKDKIKEVKKQAHNLLSDTDWYITRKSETGEAIPQEVLDERNNIRNQSENMESEINNLENKLKAYNYVIAYSKE